MIGALRAKGGPAAASSSTTWLAKGLAALALALLPFAAPYGLADASLVERGATTYAPAPRAALPELPPAESWLRRFIRRVWSLVRMVLRVMYLGSLWAPLVTAAPLAFYLDGWYRAMWVRLLRKLLEVRRV